MPRSILCGPTRLTGVAVAAALTLFAGRDASAGPITPTYLGAGVQTPNFATTCGSATSCYYGTETFSNWTGGAFTSTFQTGANNFTSTNYIQGAYTANGDTNWTKAAADQYGGANGTAPYPELFGRTSPVDAYTVTLTHSDNIPGVNYFGIWISALDSNNKIQFYNRGQLLYSFGSTDLQSALGACSTSNAYCGNPTTPFKGQNSSEIYAYVDFFDTVGYFDQIILYTENGPGFESSNHAVAFINPLTVSGTTFNAPDRSPSSASSAKLASIVVNVPEPATVMLVLTALTVLTFRHRRHRASLAAAERRAAETAKPLRRQKRRFRPAQFGWPAEARSRFSA